MDDICAEAGAALCTVPGVDKVAFTGSLDTGRRVMRACAGDVRPVSLELGGKSALVVFDDAPLEQAVEWAMFGRGLRQKRTHTRHAIKPFQLTAVSSLSASL